tara:strand:+ start:2363 stop:3295 length:933 start_codon:yes stop_codon:yes gene_type:complete
MLNKRSFLKAIMLSFLSSNFCKIAKANTSNTKKKAEIVKRTIHSSKENIPAIGMGTWLTFDVGHNTKNILARSQVLKTFFDYGGELIDSSPMYGTSERVLGKCLAKISRDFNLFSATKVWTPNTWHGVQQMKNSKKLWNIDNFNLIQVHNLVNYENHLENLFQLKEDKKINYVGVTTSHGWRHTKTIEIMKKYDLDFVQFTYNIVDREAESYLLKLAYEKKISVIANRPFQGGNLFNLIKNKELPMWAKDYDIFNWASFFLKYIISNKAVTCAIPATTQTNHMHQNMQAMYGRLPDYKTRENMSQYIKNI